MAAEPPSPADIWIFVLPFLAGLDILGSFLNFWLNQPFLVLSNAIMKSNYYVLKIKYWRFSAIYRRSLSRNK